MTSMLIGLSRWRLGILVLTATANTVLPLGRNPLTLPITPTIPLSPTILTSPATLTNLAILTDLTIRMDPTVLTNPTILTSPTTPANRIAPTSPVIRTGRVVALVVQNTLPMPVSSFRSLIALSSSTLTVRSPTAESSSIKTIPIR